MPKWIKFALALLLLPVCWGTGRALLRVLLASVNGRSDLVWVPLLGGAACWVAVFLMLPKPMWIYVAGHELTHALWTWLFGGRVKRMKITSNGGHVVVTKTNFLIALAPYFFPIYAVIAMTCFGTGSMFWGWGKFQAWYLLVLGAAYAFHVTLTAHVLQNRQSDITSQGWLFSFVVIWLGNVLLLLVSIPLLTEQVSLGTAFGWAGRHTGDVYSALVRLVRALFA